jgi:hypothetical protein
MMQFRSRSSAAEVKSKTDFLPGGPGTNDSRNTNDFFKRQEWNFVFSTRGRQSQNPVQAEKTKPG